MIPRRIPRLDSCSKKRVKRSFAVLCLVMALSEAAFGATTALDTWHLRSPLNPGDSVNTFNAVTYGGGLFVAVGHSGTIATSPDGQAWTLRNSGVSNESHCICYANGVFVAGGDRIRKDFNTFYNKIISSVL